MKFGRLKSFMWLVLLFISCKMLSQDFQKYIPFRKGTLWGLCDANKFIIVQPQYDNISWYDASVGGFHAEKNGKFGIIDHNSAQIMPFISGRPIFLNGNNYVVSDTYGDYNYSVKTKMRVGPYAAPEAVPINDRWNDGVGTNYKEQALTWDNLDDDDLAMIKPYEDEMVYRINFRSNFLEILSEDSHMGIYIPEIKKLYKSTPEIAYIGWQFYNGKPYILTTDSSQLFGMADEFSNEIYPIKYTSISLLDDHHIIILSEPDPGKPEKELFTTILPNGKALKGKFEPSGTVWKNGHEFRLYQTVVNGEKNYAGEDGTLYFEG